MWMLLIFCLGVPLLFYYFKVIRFVYWNKRNVHTASGCHWFFGHYKQILFKEKHIRTVAQKMYNEFPDSPVVGYFRLQTPGLLIRHPEVMKTILVSKFSNFGINGFFIDKKYDFLAGSNPFFVKDEEWKAVRAHATAVVTQAKLRGYLPRMRTVGAEMAKYAAARCAGGLKELDVKHLATMFTTDVLGFAICGVANNTFEEPDSLFARITREVSFATSVMDNLKDALQTAWPALSCIFQMRFATKKSEEQLVYVTRRVIEERESSGYRRDDLYQVAMSLRETDTEGVFTDEYISSLVYTVMLDQYETSSNVIVNTLLALAWHPEVQDRLRKEILQFKSNNKGDYTSDDINNLKYLDMVLAESLRVFSPVPVLSRECTNDCYIPVPTLKNPLKLTKGTPIMIPVQSMHMDPKYYPDPEKFDPERFTEEQAQNRPKYTYMPFGEGPKQCLAPRLGALQVKVAVMSIVEHFRLRPAGDNFPLPIVPGIFLISCPQPGTTKLIFEHL
ncbi:probable cytochrome P450 6a13 [Choristoneura fumiferana]|uniref:probable cytochrome P450 6a13 n=1 Tax=Choristoneura fumiferana TaxID=7141 RepID=UPI003D154520